MKRTVLFFVFAALAGLSVSAQNNNDFAIYDTITGRYPQYHYTQWYDSCPYFQQDGYVDSCYEISWWLDAPIWPGFLAKEEHTSHPIPIKGLVAMVEIPHDEYHSFSYRTKDPEYLHLYLPDGNNGLEQVYAVRFDTVTPIIMKLPTNGSATEFNYCYAFEALFDSTVYIDSTFYIAGTMNSLYTGPMEENPDYNYIRIKYLSMVGYPFGTGCYDYDPDLIPDVCRGEGHMLSWNPGGAEPDSNRWDEEVWNVFGYYLPILDDYNVEVQPADASMGNVSLLGHLADGNVDTLIAIPNIGFEFAQWSDGNTDNPRLFTIVQDTSFTAEFKEKSGIQEPGINTQGLGISPNPAHNQISLKAAVEGSYQVDIYNSNGSKVKSHRFEGTNTIIDISSLPIGAYYLKLTSDNFKGVAAFVRK